MAGDYAADGDRSDRARRAWQVTRDLWKQLDDEQAAARVDAQLEDN